MNIRSIQNNSYMPQYKRTPPLQTKTEEPSLSCKKIDEIPSSYLRGSFGIINNKNSLSFGQKHLYQINLKKRQPTGHYEFIPAYFSKLNPRNEDDRYFMEKLDGFWSPKSDRNMAGDIAEDFFSERKNKENNFYIIEKNDNEYYVDTFCRTTAVVETTNPKSKNKSKFEIKYLQTNPDILYQDTPEIKGSGELMLYGCVKEAKKNGFDMVEIYSSNDSFYEHLGLIERPKAHFFTLYPQEYDYFLERIEKKYNLKQRNFTI